MAMFFVNVTDNETTSSKDDAPTEASIYFIIGMLSIFSVFGTFGNSLTIYVFSKMLKQKLTSTVFILALAGTDLITCSITIPSTILFKYYGHKVLYDLPCKVYVFIMTSTVPYSSMLMVAIGIDRYLCICHPFRQAMNIQRARMLVLGMACLIFPLALIISLFYGVYEIKVPSNSSCLYSENSEWFWWFNDSHKNISLLLRNYNESLNIFNLPFNANSTCETSPQITYTGKCKINEIIFPQGVMRAFQYIHSSLFVIAIVIVFILYGLILKRVLAQKQSRKGLSPMNLCCKRKRERSTLRTLNGKVEGDSHSDHNFSEHSPSLLHRGGKRRGSKKGDKMFIANLKIAGTLFTVTLVFCLAFLPAYLMALSVISYNRRLFYAYFVYNIANPVIYAFLNSSFRDQVKIIFLFNKQKKRPAAQK